MRLSINSFISPWSGGQVQHFPYLPQTFLSHISRNETSVFTLESGTKAALNAAKIANYYCILANDNSSRKEITKRIENMMNQIFNTQEISTINQAIKNCQPDWELYLSLEDSNTSQKNFKLSLILK